MYKQNACKLIIELFYKYMNTVGRSILGISCYCSLLDRTNYKKRFMYVGKSLTE
jgi:hypothetical protein